MENLRKNSVLKEKIKKRLIRSNSGSKRIPQKKKDNIIQPPLLKHVYSDKKLANLTTKETEKRLDMTERLLAKPSFRMRSNHWLNLETKPS